MAPLRVLVLGGSQFMGRLTVEALLAEGHEVTCINRGRTQDPFGDDKRLRRLHCDRVGDRARFRQLVRDLGSMDAVVDFTGFHEVYVQDVLAALSSEGKGSASSFSVGHYVIVSSSSVYWALRVPEGGDSRLQEDAAQEFTPAEYERHLARCKLSALGDYQIRYGGTKLGCERVLEEAWQNASFPYTALRLPDVYGPLDNRGSFWDLVAAVEEQRPVPAYLPPERMRETSSGQTSRPQDCRFTWAFAFDVRDAILAVLHRGAAVHGTTLNVGHEEAVTLGETTEMIAAALGHPAGQVRLDFDQEASLPSTDFGSLDISRSTRLLAPWRPTPMKEAVRKAISWWTSSAENRRHHRSARCGLQEPGPDGSHVEGVSELGEVRRIWAGSEKRAAFARDAPVLLSDALPDLTGQNIVSFMQSLMEQAGQLLVMSELRRGDKVEEEEHELRHLAGNLLTQSSHGAARRLVSQAVLEGTDLTGKMPNPIGEDFEDPDAKQDRRPRVLCLGGVGARSQLQRDRNVSHWDCLLLGRRRWRLFPPETPAETLCSEGDSSPVDTFIAGPSALAAQKIAAFASFGPKLRWECEQCVGEAVVVPAGWWAQTYDDERTLSVGGRFVLPEGEAEAAVVEEEDDDVENYETVD